MAGLTEHFGFQTLRAGIDKFSENGSKFTDEDRHLMDRLLYLALAGHRHTGDALAEIEPVDPPELTLSDGGSLPAGARIYYVFTVVDSNGSETAASPEAYIDMPPPVPEPSTPSLSYTTDPLSGTMWPGTYYYALSAWTGSNTLDTRAPNVASINIPASAGNNNYITINLPSLPSGADGFNIYRRKPGSAEFFYIDSVDIDAIDLEEGKYYDVGIEEDCDRRPSTTNSTNTNNSVIVTWPGGTPTVPEGYTWKIYRSYVSSTYHDSLLHWVVEETEEDSGIIVTEYTDVGEAVQPGSPPVASLIAAAPSQVDLRTETTGALPVVRVRAFPAFVEFRVPGVAEVIEGPEVWMCPYPAVLLDQMSVNVGWDEFMGEMATPNNEVTLALMRSVDTGDTWDEVATIGLGIDASYAISPETPEMFATLEQGDMLRMDVVTADASATPTTPSDLRVTIRGWMNFVDEPLYVPGEEIPESS